MNLTLNDYAIIADALRIREEFYAGLDPANLNAARIHANHAYGSQKLKHRIQKHMRDLTR
jgi:hypothetical protein